MVAFCMQHCRLQTRGFLEGATLKRKYHIINEWRTYLLTSKYSFIMQLYLHDNIYSLVILLQATKIVCG